MRGILKPDSPPIDADVRTTPSPETDLSTRPQDAPAVWPEEQASEKRGGRALRELADQGKPDEALTIQGGSLVFFTPIPAAPDLPPPPIQRLLFRLLGVSCVR